MPLGVSWARFGGVLAGSWRGLPGGLGASWLLGLSWERFWTVLGAFWVHCGSILGTFLRSFWDSFDVSRHGLFFVRLCLEILNSRTVLALVQGVLSMFFLNF